jgi:RNA polymerase sigma-70 factor (ECF subfamily)
MSSESTDAKLVKRVQKGDKGAFDLLVLKYQHKIVNLVMRYVRDPEQASGAGAGHNPGSLY